MVVLGAGVAKSGPPAVTFYVSSHSKGDVLMNNEISISSINDIENLFNRIKNDEDISIDRIKFRGLTDAKFKIFGDTSRYNGSIPASLAQGMCDFQTEMYKVYTLIKYKTDNLQKLTNKDREEIEIIFEVNEGCTELVAKLGELIEIFANAFEKITHGMSPTQKTTCFIFFVTLLCGAWLGTSYLDNKTEVESKQIEQQSEVLKQKSEAERMSILKDGMLETIKEKAGVDAIDRAEGIQEHTTKAYVGILKGASDADKIEIGGMTPVILSQNQVHEIIKNPVDRAKNEQRTLEVVIDGIKRSPDKITVSCREPSGEEGFSVSVDPSFIDKDEVDLLFDAMKENRSVKVLGNFKIRSGVIEQGVASEITNP